MTSVVLTVLTVDDSRTMRDMLKHSLVAAGFRVLQAEDGIDGLEVLKTETPDVIVTDINMPRLDGFGIIEAVRRDAGRRGMPCWCLRPRPTRRRRAAQRPLVRRDGSSSHSTRSSWWTRFAA
jgi:two-component system chemotaxis response regulator CheY